MGRFLVASVLAVVTLGTLAVSVPRSSPRQARWFLSRADVTEVVEEERMVTQATPWSCVVVAPSLPPCRHVRQLNIAATPPTPISATAAPGLARFYGDHNQVEASRRRYYLEQAMAPAGSMEAYHGDLVPVPTSPHGPHTGWVPLMSREATEPLPAAAAVPEAPAVPVPPPAPTAPPAPPTAQVPVKKREQGWAEWLGLRAYTVTTTVVQLATTKVVDPKTVVTFSVRGCQPSVLPFDLPLCVAQDPAQPETPAVEVSAAAPAAPPAETVAAEAAQAPAPAPAEKPPSMAPIVVAAAPPSQSAQSDKPVEKPAEESAEPNKA